MTPPIASLEGMWQISRTSVMGACGVEPSTWKATTDYFKLSWSGLILETYRCSSPTVCVAAPWAYGDFYWQGGEWLAAFQTVKTTPTCLVIQDQARLKLLDSGVLRRITGHYEASGDHGAACGPPQVGDWSCSQEYIEEATRIATP